MKVAIAGKGGAGKTTLAATLARLFARDGYSVLAIDGDPNPNLGVALGLNQTSLAALHPLPRAILQESKDSEGVSRTTLTAPVETIAATHGVVAPDGVRLLLTAQVDHAGAG